MGLDMYLDKHVYVGAEYEHREVTGKIEIFSGGKPIPVNFKKVSYIVERVGYWRKANQIHAWIVKNVQDGNDDCEPHYFDHDKMQELLDIVNKVLGASKLVKGVIQNGTTYDHDHPEGRGIFEAGEVIEDDEVARELLPASDGFFFGSTDYDQYYYEDLEITKKILTEALADESGEYYYHSSW